MVGFRLGVGICGISIFILNNSGNLPFTYSVIIPQPLSEVTVAIASSDFATRVFSRVRFSAPRPTPGYPGGPMFSVRVVSLS
jgi:hypothetical protein